MNSEQVLSEKTKQLIINEIENPNKESGAIIKFSLSMAHVAAVALGRRRVYTSDEGGKEVEVFDLEMNKLGSIHWLGENGSTKKPYTSIDMIMPEETEKAYKLFLSLFFYDTISIGNIVDDSFPKGERPSQGWFVVPRNDFIMQKIMSAFPKFSSV